MVLMPPGPSRIGIIVNIDPDDLTEEGLDAWRTMNEEARTKFNKRVSELIGSFLNAAGNEKAMRLGGSTMDGTITRDD